MRERDFAYAVARIRVLENKLLDNGQFERLANAVDLSEAIAFLGETDYNASLVNLTNPQQFEVALDGELERVIRLVLELSDSAPEIKVFVHRYDLENMKRILKETELKPEKLSRLGFWSPEWLLDKLETGDYGELPAEFAQGLQEATRAYKDTGDVQEIDCILDQAWFNLGYRVLKNGISKLLFKWWISMIDLTNLRSFVRLRTIGLQFSDFARFFIENGSWLQDEFRNLWDQPVDKLLIWLGNTNYAHLLNQGTRSLNSLTVLERECDDFLTEMIGQAKFISLGIEPLVGYLIAKEIEIKILRVILVGKNNQISNSNIKERLRRAYA